MIKVKKLNNKEIQVNFQYDQDLVKKIRKIDGRRWEQHSKCWIIPNNSKSINKFIKVFINEDVNWSEPLNYTILNFKDFYCFDSESTLKELEKQLTLKGFTNKTKKAYIGHSRRFLEFIDKKPQDLMRDDVEKYMFFLLNEQENSHAYVNQALSAIKFYYNYVLKKGQIIYNLSRPKKEKKLPNILSEEEVLSILDAVTNIKHKAILFVIYSAGLRVGEVVRLKVEDIDSDRMLIHVRQGKGRKDRYTMLSEVTLEMLRKYARIEKPKDWLFPPHHILLQHIF